MIKPDYAKMSEKEFARRMKWELFQNRFKSLCKTIFKKYLNAFVGGVCLTSSFNSTLHGDYGWAAITFVLALGQLFFIVHKELYGY